LEGHDLIVVIGAPVFRYYPYVPGPILPDGAALLQITTDPTDAGSAMVGDSLLSDVKLAMDELLPLLDESTRHTPAARLISRDLPTTPGSPLTSNEVYATLSEVRPEGAIVVQESPSNYNEFLHWWPSTEEGSYFTYASGGLGHNAPSSVGVALAQRKLGTNRPVIVLIGDGSLQYSVQSLSAAAQHKLNMVYIVPCNGEYAILKEFAVLEKTPNVPSLDLPFLDIVSLAKGYGCHATRAETRAEIQAAFKEALAAEGPTVIAIPIKRELKSLIPSTTK
jgi:benzoylformate decarboxylase